MKKLIIAACAAMLGIAANAAQVEWGMTGVTDSPDVNKAAGWAVYVMDASTYDTFTGKTGAEVAAYVAANKVAQGTTASGRTGVSATVTGGSYAGGDTVNSYMVLFNNADAASATYYAYTPTASTTISAGGADGTIAYGTFTAATTSTGGWHQAIPEPTSGLLMLVGLGALALRRRRA